MNTTTIQLPFAGFYCSNWDAELDSALERNVEYLAEGDGLPEGVEYAEAMSAACGLAKYDLTLVARRYAEEFLHTLGKIIGLPGDGEGFTELTSPRYYNFETDRVFAAIPRAWVESMSGAVYENILDRIAAKRHTSRDGFISFYSPDWVTWGELEDWDHNQLLTLLLAYLETVGEDADEIEDSILDHLRGNGVFDEAIGLDSDALIAALEENANA